MNSSMQSTPADMILPRYDAVVVGSGLGGLTWMSIGAFIMAKMVSFEI